MAIVPGGTLVDSKSTTFSHAAELSSPSQLVANNSLSEVIICWTNQSTHFPPFVSEEHCLSLCQIFTANSAFWGTKIDVGSPPLFSGCVMLQPSSRLPLISSPVLFGFALHFCSFTLIYRKGKSLPVYCTAILNQTNFNITPFWMHSTSVFIFKIIHVSSSLLFSF